MIRFQKKLFLERPRQQQIVLRRQKTQCATFILRPDAIAQCGPLADLGGGRLDIITGQVSAMEGRW